MVRIGLSQMFARGTQNAWDDGACQEEDQDQPYWYGGHSPVVTL